LHVRVSDILILFPKHKLLTNFVLLLLFYFVLLVLHSNIWQHFTVGVKKKTL